MAEAARSAEEFSRLLSIMKRLRAPDGCPWDREQNYMSLRRYILEEAYELIEAIESGDLDNMTEECGDVMLQVVFISTIAEERGDFDVCDVLNYISSKLVRRHPHVFGDISVKNSDEVLKNWEQIKSTERKEKNKDDSIIAGVPRGLPALLRSLRIQERAAKVGFDWRKEQLPQLFDKVQEELNEVRHAVAEGNSEAVAEEAGDLLFACVNLSRHLKTDPETALHRATEKFAKRFRFVEQNVAESGREWKDYTLDELDMFWNEAKNRG